MVTRLCRTCEANSPREASLPQPGADELLDALAAIAVAAGRLILACRPGGGPALSKPDGSPQTEADRAADALIAGRLRALAPDIPVVSEEGGPAGWTLEPEAFFLVDPLDGTRDFMGGFDEFTVNLAYVRHGRPEAGIVLAPALGELFAGSPSGAFVQALGADLSPAGEPRPLGPLRPPEAAPRAVASRSHRHPGTDALLAALPAAGTLCFGSALKFCRLAEGRAELYPRLGPTMEWDTAAGEAVLTAAGGLVVDLDGSPLVYGKHAAGFRNPPFLAATCPELAGRAAALARSL